MTATTDTATTPGTVLTETTVHAAIQRLNSGMYGGQGYNFPTEPYTNGRGNLTSAIISVFSTHTIEQIMSASGDSIRASLDSAGYRVGTADDVALTRLRDAVVATAGLEPPEPEDTSTPEDKASRLSIGTRIINETAWPVRLWLAGLLGDTYEETWDSISSTLLYQFNNWSRGVYLSTSEASRFEQYERRMGRIGAQDHLTNRARRFVKAALNRLWEVSQGGTPKDEYPPAPASTEFWVEIAKRWRGFDGERSAQGIGRSHTYWGYSDAAYYVGVALEYWVDHLNARDNVSSDDPAREHEEFTVANLTWWLDRYSSQGRSAGYGADEFPDLIEAIHLARGGGNEVEVGPVTTVEGLIEFLLANENNLPDFYTAAITRGAQDLVDRFREGEKVDVVVNELRREVRKYGYLKFTGRGYGRATLEQVLTNLRDEVAGKPLSAEEWRARHERFKTAVQFVAGRYGEVQDMCSVLEKATAELGLEPVRKPQRLARLEGDGLVIDVPVETWRDWSNGLAEHAQRAWTAMSPEGKEAAVVSRVGVHVNWSAMRSAF